MTDSGLAYLDKSDSFELGAGAALTVVDAGFAKSMTTTTARDDAPAIAFGKQGLMGRVGLKGSKITRFNPE